MKIRKSTLALVSGAGILKLAFAPLTAIGEDERALLAQALEFVKNRMPAFHGARVVYSDTVLPGMMQDILFGLPALLAGGNPLGSVWVAALANWIAWILVWRIYVELFPKIPALLIGATIFFAPWTYVYTGFINPAYLVPASAACYFALFRLSQLKQDTWQSARLWAVVAASWVFAFQFNLSFVLLVIFSALAVGLKTVPRPGAKSLTGLLAGGALSGLTLLPSLLVSRMPKTTLKSSSLFDLISKNMHFDAVHFQDLYKIAFRFLSFPTAETTRFIGGPRGFGGALEKMAGYPVFQALFVLVLGMSLATMAWGLFFYLSPRLIRSRLKLQGTDLRSRWDRLIWAAPFATMVLFVVSIKEPSAHTLLPLLPLSFFPLLSGIERLRGRFAVSSESWGALCLCGLAFSLGTYVWFCRPHVWELNQMAAEQALGRTPKVAAGVAIDPEVMRILVEMRKAAR